MIERTVEQKNPHSQQPCGFFVLLQIVADLLGDCLGVPWNAFANDGGC